MTDLGIEYKQGEVTRAFLVGVYRGGSNKESCAEHLNELAHLADTFGVEVVAKMSTPSRRVDAATYLQSGKLEEIKEEVARVEANLIIFDEEISPAQQRNLEKLFKIAVMDRTELILEIFAQRARTKEARLQIELAQTEYEFPRLKRLWSHFSRQRASGGFLKGEGEKQLEIDRRLLKHRLHKLNAQLKEVKRNRAIQSEQRRKSGIPTFAIIGYTNAGKSTLLNALTEAEVFVEDKLFATLDPTTRKFTLPNNQEVLLSDTVGFIRKLPHTLVAAFRSTLEAALHDDILLHLVDVSHPQADEHVDATFQILKELKIDPESMITVLNKADLCENHGMINKLRIKCPKNVVISALKQEGFELLIERMVRELANRRKRVELCIPQSEYALVGLLHREGNVLSERYEENDVVMSVDLPLQLLYKVDVYSKEATST